MRKIVFMRPDGGLSVVHPVRNTVQEPLTTDLEIEQRAWKRLPADAISPQFVSTVPSDRTYRNAWTLGPGGIEHDMSKCRALHRNRMRERRVPLLAALDTAYLRADEAGDIAEKKRISTQKQALRDVTADPAIDAATTPDELKTIWPEILK